MRLRKVLMLVAAGAATVGCHHDPTPGIHLVTPDLVSAWGTPGSLPGQFDHAVDIAAGGGGSVYVADAGNHRVQRFTEDGDFVEEFGSAGTGPGRFDDLIAVGADTAGRVVTLEGPRLRLQAWGPGGDLRAVRSALTDAGFDSSAVPALWWGFLGVVPEGGFAASGYGLVGDPNPRVRAFLTHYSYEGGLKSAVDWGGEFCDFTLRPDEVPIFQFGDVVRTLRFDGTPVDEVSTPEPPHGAAFLCKRFALDPAGRIYVTTVTYGTWSIPVTAIYSPEGELLAETELAWDALAVAPSGDLYALLEDRVYRYRNPVP
jgi:NHL repeat